MTRGLGVDLPVRRDDLSHGDFRDVAWRSDSSRRGMDGDVGRLHALLSLDEIFECAVDHVKDRRVAAKVGGKPAFDAVLRLDNFLDDFEISLDVGAAKSIDRLLWIADHEYFPGRHFYVAPIRRRVAELLGQVEENLILDWISVLNFGDIFRRPTLDISTDRLVGQEQVFR